MVRLGRALYRLRRSPRCPGRCWEVECEDSIELEQTPRRTASKTHRGREYVTCPFLAEIVSCHRVWGPT